MSKGTPFALFGNFCMPGHKERLLITHNSHIELEMDVASYLEGETGYSFPTEANKQQAIEQNQLWSVQWVEVKSGKEVHVMAADYPSLMSHIWDIENERLARENPETFDGEPN